MIRATFFAQKMAHIEKYGCRSDIPFRAAIVTQGTANQNLKGCLKDQHKQLLIAYRILRPDATLLAKTIRIHITKD
ncbi:hypothetical protein TH15_16140 [Thalassospira profundimaris]|nr:hypothetical protein TH15_16140 [Thalassospira profundimaris]